MGNTNKIIIALVVVVIILAGIYFVMRGNSNPTPASQPVSGNQQSAAQNNSATAPASQPAPAAEKAVTINLSAQNNSGQTGTAVLTDLGNGKTSVTVTLNGEPQGATEPEHIHVGSCANLGAVKYPLNPIMNGKAETTIDVSLADILNNLPMAINAHKSASEINVYYACGDITAGGSATSAPAPVTQQQKTNPAPAPSPSTGGGNFGY